MVVLLTCDSLIKTAALSPGGGGRKLFGAGDTTTQLCQLNVAKLVGS